MVTVATRRATKDAWHRLVHFVVAVAACGGLVTSCGPAVTAQPIGQFGGRAVLGISNGTPLAVTLFVNDQAVGTAIQGAAFEPLDFASLPPQPWTVEARAPSGRVLTSMEVRPDAGLTLNSESGRIIRSCLDGVSPSATLSTTTTKVRINPSEASQASSRGSDVSLAIMSRTNASL